MKKLYAAKSNKKLDIGQGQDRPKEMWVLFDMPNGNAGSRRYLWWFETRKQALEHRKWQHSLEHGAELSMPFRYLISK